MDELQATGFMDQFSDAMSMASGLNRALKQVGLEVVQGAVCVGMEHHKFVWLNLSTRRFDK